MPDDFLKRVDRLLAEALERPAAERVAFVTERAGGDRELAARVERLLEAEGRVGDFLEPRAPLVETPGDPDLPAGTRLGAYTVIEPIGRGGMGTVYLAERRDEHYRQRVAIKTLRRDVVHPSSVERFRWERQLLASLEHPGIARLYDGGDLPDGRPYLVLEYVEGLPIDRHCDRAGLGIEERLALFVRVAEAVERAHRSLLAHRDLKPGNILVGADSLPKLVDFGIAKLLDAAEGGSPTTQTGLLPLTPAYASPEQIRRQPVGTASDVYSLGVVLYELLTGRSPYGDAIGHPDRLIDAICRDEPRRPSAAVLEPGRSSSGSEVAPEEAARVRGATPRQLSRRLAGDLDNVVLKAMRKEPERRYGTAAELGRDVALHLANLPVSARRDTFGYRARKFVARHPVGVVAGALALTVATAFLAAWIRQEDALRRERDRATAALSFLVGTFEGADPYGAPATPGTAQDLLDRGADRLSQAPPADPAVEAALLDAIGRAYLGLGYPDPAAPLLERAREIQERLLGERHPETIRAISRVALVEQRRGDYRAAETTARRAVALTRDSARPGLELAEALRALGSILSDQARYEEGLEPLGEALAIYRRQAPADSEAIGATLVAMAISERELGRFDDAGAHFVEALELERRAVGADHPRVARLESDYALVLIDRGEAPEGERVARRALEAQRRRLRPEHPDTTVTLNNLAVALQHQGRLDESEATFREVVGLQRRHAGIAPTYLARTLNNLASVIVSQGRAAEAVPLLTEALELNRQGLGDTHDQVAFGHMQLARALWKPGDDEAAIGHEREAIAVLERLWKGEDHPTLAYPLQDLGRMLVARGEAAEGEKAVRRALALHEKFKPADHWEVPYARSALGEALLVQERFAEAEALLLPAYEDLSSRPELPPDDGRVRKARSRLVALYEAWDRPTDAARFREPTGVTPAPARP